MFFKWTSAPRREMSSAKGLDMARDIDLLYLADPDLASQSLHAGGVNPAAAMEKARLVARAATALSQAAVSGPADAYWIPGRIEVLGKHTDYAGGHSVLAAAERGFCFVAAARTDRRISVTEAGGGESVSFEIDPDLVPRANYWANYPMTVTRRLARNFPSFRRGADIAFASDLPPAAGMSSSSALLVGSYLALAAINDLEEDGQYGQNIDSTLRLAEYLGTIENGQSFGTLAGDRGVGTFGGSEDHTAILCCRPGRLSRYAYCPTRFQEQVTLPAAYTFVVGASGVMAEKTGAAQEKFNRASRLAGAVVDLWNEATGNADPHLAAIVERGADACGQLERMLAGAQGAGFSGQELLNRFAHFYAENGEIIPAAMAALDGGDVKSFGAAVDRSQELGARLLGNQVPETVDLAALAREEGAVAASAFGAGFGGSVWALVEERESQSFSQRWRSAYLARFPSHSERARFFVTAAGPAAFRL